MQYLNPFKLFNLDSNEVDNKSIELIRNQIENEYMYNLLFSQSRGWSQ